MAPPPFKVVGKLPEPLTVEETAATFRIPPPKVEAVMVALRASLARHESKLAKTAKGAKAAKQAKASKVAKTSKIAKTSTAGRTPRRLARQASKAAYRSRR